MLNENGKQLPKFDIRDHLSQLNPVKKQKGKYYCPNPNCNSNNLSINQKTGAYDCYTCHDLPAIREALSPLKEKLAQLNPEPKQIRPKQIREWIYFTIDRQPLIKVKREDDGNGKRTFKQYHYKNGKWLIGYGDVKREDIPIYRYQECMEAIAAGKTILIVEGESIADLLWSLGIPATCNIGGSGHWMSHHTEQLKGAKIVLCPDRDVPGIKHIEKIAQDFPEAQYLYAYPNSKAWENLPENQGLDLLDWIQDYNLKAEDVLKAIEPTKRVKAITEKSNLINAQDKFGELRFTAEMVKERLIKIIETHPCESQLQGLINELSHESLWNIKELYSLYKTLIKELEIKDYQDETKEEVEKIQTSQKKRLNLERIFPQNIINPIITLANRLNLRPEVFATALLCGVSSLHHPKTKVLLFEGTNFTVSPNLYGGIIAEPSQKKSPILKSMILSPMRNLQAKAREQFKEELKNYQEKLDRYEYLKRSKNNEDKEALRDEFPDGKPTEPRQKIYFFTNTTGEGILHQVAAHPDQGLMYVKDELAGIFKSANQYRGGKGSDSEDLLEYYDGTAGTVLRSSGVASDVNDLLLGLFGGVQPKILEKMLGDCEDGNGNWSRFMFVHQPVTASELNPNHGKINIDSMINDLYERFDLQAKIPETFTLSKEATAYFCKAYNEFERKRVKEKRPAMAHVWGKSGGRIGKIAVNLHVMEAVAKQCEPSREIGLETIKNAVTLTEFFAEQIESLYVAVDGENLPSNLAKILEIAEKSGDWISPRDVIQSSLRINGKRVNSTQVIELFKQLKSMGKGEILTTGRSTKFKISSNVVNVVNNVVRDDNIPESLQDKDLSSNVVNVVNVVNFQENNIISSPIEKIAISEHDNLIEKNKLFDNIDNNDNIKGEIVDLIDSQNVVTNVVNENNFDNINDQNLNLIDSKNVVTNVVNENNFDNINQNDEIDQQIEEAIALLETCEIKEDLVAYREIIPPDILRLASRKLSKEKHEQIKQWIFELDHLFIDETVEIIETEDKGKRGTITTIKDSNGHSSGDRGIYNNCPKLGKEWSLTITFDDGSTETFYPDQVAKLD